MSRDDVILDSYIERGFVHKLMGEVSRGKEACVYLGLFHEEFRAIKIFRDRSQKSFRNKTDYDMSLIPSNRREARALKNKTSFGKKLDDHLWYSRETKSMQELYDAGADVPEIFTSGDSSFVMECFMDEGRVAPKLSSFKNTLEGPHHVYGKIIDNIKIFLSLGYVHGDLSPYNILCNQKEEVMIIDFPQTVNIKYFDIYKARELLIRDLENVGSFFVKNYGIEDRSKEILEYFDSSIF